ncbi:hypothetical protein P3X46_026275 [Hevea brasiliensis]|uniref:Partial AB-hydrolase lipase domain-containing protein n=1 Tax=Hevea brasiliensis TaxID=3981 RepID=A0ABQ9KXR6_HEVBR|nr:hypothetical protein P3X46_026275 [Hevea brasiliensis]
MALHGLPMLFAGFAFFVLNLFLMPLPHHVYGQNDPPAIGLCDSSVRIHGYKCNEFQVTTQDGYILGLQRIPEGRSAGGDSANKPPVLLQHGVLVDGMVWLMNAPEQNLPMILADKGFDVWIANTRGTRFSRRHTYLQPNQSEFWNWPWDDLIAYDLPAVFDYVHNQTGQKLHYVGHSLGTLLALASFTEGLLVNQVKSAALLSPIAFLSHMKTAFDNAAAKAFAAEATAFFGMAEINPLGEAGQRFLKIVCAKPGVNCFNLLRAITGKNCCLNASAVDFFLKNELQSTATKNMVHLAQRQDALSDTEDVAQLLDDLKFHDVLKLTVQFVKDYAHADFVSGVNATDIVYSQVYKFFMNHHF